MNEPKRRFFSGDSLQQALVQAANHFNLAPEEIAYRSIEKRHGFLKVRRKVVIEVDPEAPRREAGAPPLPPALSAAPPSVAVRQPVPPGEGAARPRSGERREQRGPGRDRPPRQERHPRGGREDRRGDDRGNRAAGRGGEGGPRRDDFRHRRPAGGGLERRAEGAPPLDDEAALLVAGAMASARLVALPEGPRRPTERFPEASGPIAEAAAKGVELLLRIAGLELVPRVLQGEDRLEVDLSGADVDWCFADDGELVLAIEHLLPRMIRSLSGEGTLVRVDCDNFQEIREERLRSLAQKVAEEVRRHGKARTLEPMNPADRRIIHITLADDPGVATESQGDSYFKRIIVRPT
jgi:spoIIIJ-associated protein